MQNEVNDSPCILIEGPGWSDANSTADGCSPRRKLSEIRLRST
jgi:hypothetical protein